MICCKCEKEITIDPTEEMTGYECPQCGGIYCTECGGWTVANDELICVDCSLPERAKIERWDLVDNAIFELMEKLNPSNKTTVDWPTDGVAEARAEIRRVLIKLFCEKMKTCTEEEFYP
jgi:hypothetical protein